MSSKKANQLRIIGGRWRGRKLQFPDINGLRPTPDRVRETLFNWLMPVMPGSRCLDLYAGSGALGFESLSRGASEVVFVDNAREVSLQLHRDIEQLQAQGALVQQQPVVDYLSARPRTFDIVFIDPPYAAGLLATTLTLLGQGWVRPGSRIYFECSAAEPEPPLPQGWQVLRSKRAGQVAYYLAGVSENEAADKQG